MKRIIAILFILLLLMICISSQADSKQDEIEAIISKEKSLWNIEIDPNEGDWANV